MSLLAAIGHLSLAVTALVLGGRTPLSRRFAGLCFVLFGWNFTTVASHWLGGGATFTVVDAIFTSLSPPAVLEVVVVFVGVARRYRMARALAWGVFGALAAASAGGLFSDAVVRWIDEPSWSALFLVAWGP